MNKEQLRQHLYNDTIAEAVKYVNTIIDEESLAVYAYNYNWDNGFAVPYAILKNNSCSLSIALLLFELADGFTFLKSKEVDSALPEWSSFMKELYGKVMNNTFPAGNVSFTPELSKFQLLKIEKLISDDEHVFITPIEGIDYHIYL